MEALGRGRLRFSGRLRFEPLGSPRPLVIIQTLNALRAWQGVGTFFRVSPSGEYSVTYHGKRDVIGGSYAFRIVAPGTALFASGISTIRRALVR